MTNYKLKNIAFLLFLGALTNINLNIHSNYNKDYYSNYNKNYYDVFTLEFSLAETSLSEYHLRHLAEKLKRNPTLEEADKYARKLGIKPNSDKSSLEKFIDKHNSKIMVVSGVVAYIGMVLGLIYVQIKMIEATTKSYFKAYQPGEIKDNFNSVAGKDEAKEAFQDIVEYLKNPSLYSKIGAKPTKGILLTGAPGTGKTLLAKALAGEANCAFIYASGSEFTTMWQGSGTQNIKSIFNTARNQYKYFNNKKTPCILFIDEIDVLARRRGTGDNYGDQTVNQLLTELDGFIQEENPIIVIAATNFPEKIDPAFLRPGRIDRTIHIEAPSLTDRNAILKLHLQKIKHNKNLNTTSIAQRTIGFTGAELAEIIHSAARIAVNRKGHQVEQVDLENALDNRTIGIQSKIPLSEQERKIVAYHEAGHALINLLLNKKEVLNKITILPRGNALGVTHFIKTEELDRIITKEEFLNKICMCLGGRAAEEIIFNVISTSPSSDLQNATNIAQAMIKHYGMGTNLAVETFSNKLPESMQEKEISILLKAELERSKELLIKNIDKLHKLANALLEKETLYTQDIANLNLF
jgi:cell division protease FtsH